MRRVVVVGRSHRDARFPPARERRGRSPRSPSSSPSPLEGEGIKLGFHPQSDSEQSMTTRQRMAPLRYDPREIDAKWQRRWADDALYQVRDDDPRPRWYALTMYPYPSGDLHIGHWYAMAPSDAHARFMRMRGYNVLHPMGFDAFGLPAENAAINRGIHPARWTMDNIQRMRGQLQSMGPVLRLEPRGGYVPAGVLRVESVVLPADVREGAGLSGVRAGELGAPPARRCSRTSRSWTASASARGTSSSGARWISGSSRSRTTRTSCSTSPASWTGRSVSRRCRRTG